MCPPGMYRRCLGIFPEAGIMCGYHVASYLRESPSDCLTFSRILNCSGCILSLTFYQEHKQWNIFVCLDLFHVIFTYFD